MVEAGVRDAIGRGVVGGESAAPLLLPKLLRPGTTDARDDDERTRLDRPRWIFPTRRCIRIFPACPGVAASRST